LLIYPLLEADVGSCDKDLRIKKALGVYLCHPLDSQGPIFRS
jgi:hypothetical protein